MVVVLADQKVKGSDVQKVLQKAMEVMQPKGCSFVGCQVAVA